MARCHRHQRQDDDRRHARVDPAGGGLRTIAAGNVGVPLVEAVLADPPYDVIAVEMSSFQLHWSSTITFDAATILNVAEDHLDWHGSFEAYAAAKAKIWEPPDPDEVPYVLYNADDANATRLAAGFSDRQCFTLGEPSDACLGIRGGVLQGFGLEPLTAVTELPLAGPHNVANALAAAGLARQLALSPHYPVTSEAVRAGLLSYHPGPHRNALVTTVDGVAYVDDSKATNPHAAAASLSAYDSVVWIAGGLLKGANVDELVAAVRSRLRAVVLIGRDRAQIAAAIARHARDVPVVEVAATDTRAMAEAVAAATRLAHAGDTVLLAPAAASMDMFADYAERGDAFAAAALALRKGRA